MMEHNDLILTDDVEHGAWLVVSLRLRCGVEAGLLVTVNVFMRDMGITADEILH